MLDKFLFDIQMASGLFRPRSAVDSPRLDSERIETILEGSDFWLTHGSDKGYEPEDFGFLREDERNQLAMGVEQFQPVNVKARNSKLGSVTEGEMARAKAGFRRILEVIRPDKYADIDAFVIGKKIENQVRDEMPDWVREMVFETGYDVGGDPALWIWVEVEDRAADDEVLRANFLLIREILGHAAAQVCPERWPYIRLRTVSEQRPLAGADRR